MNSLLTTVCECFEQEGIGYSLADGQTILKTGFAGKNGMFDCVTIIDDECRDIVVITMFPLRVMAERHPHIAERLMSINCGLKLGAFKLNVDTGIVSFETNAYFGKADAQLEFLKHLVFRNWVTIDVFFPEIAAMILGSKAADKNKTGHSEMPSDCNSSRRLRTRSRFNGDIGPEQN